MLTRKVRVIIMNIQIRHEQESDYRHVEELARIAFWNLYFPGAHEHFVVHKMRKHKDFIENLSHVLEIDGTVQGAIFYTHSKVTFSSGIEYPVISFGPVFIAPSLHRQGFGKMLINHTIAKAKADGYSAMITLGYPYHYAPYGFVGAKKYNIAMGDGKFYKGLLALGLNDDAFNVCLEAQKENWVGQAVFSDVFEVDEKELEIFDATFAPLEKAFQESQKEFEIACSALDE